MKLGIIGAGTIIKDFFEAMEELEGIVSVASISVRPESLEKHRPVYEPMGIDVYSDVNKMMEEADIDTVYVALPNQLHFEYSMKALKAGKHVICEKPLVPTADQARALRDEARKQEVLIFEAITTLYQKYFLDIKDLLSQEKIGSTKIVECNYSQYSRRYDKFKEGIILPAFDPDMYGGALMDINSYNVHFAVGLFGRPLSQAHYPNVEKGIDTSGVLVLKYPGFVCICTGAKDCSTGSKANISIQGDKGTILVDSPANTLTTYRLEPVKGTSESKKEIFNHRMTEEFKMFAEYIKNKDFGAFEEKMEHSIIVMGILEEARKQTPGTL